MYIHIHMYVCVSFYNGLPMYVLLIIKLILDVYGCIVHIVVGLGPCMGVRGVKEGQAPDSPFGVDS